MVIHDARRHAWAAIITFSAHEGDDGNTVARIHLMVRAIDPLYEAGVKIYTSRLEDKIWTHTLTSLAAHFHCSDSNGDRQDSGDE